MKTGKVVKENQPRPLPTSGNKTSAPKKWQLLENAGKSIVICKGGSKENLKRQDEDKLSAISRRKLEFKEKLPLAGKKIYLDLKGVKQEKKVEEKLEKFGATIEKFLSKEIHYFVTNQDKEKGKNDDQSPNGSPNMSISSPFNSGHTPSPSNFEKKTFTVTRGKAMLQCARLDSAADNIVERAKKLGVKIVPYLSLMKWLIKEQSRIHERVKEAPPVAKKAKVEDNQKSKKLLYKARNLKQPFIKFEAVNKFYRPIQMELNSWPFLNMNSSQGSCPFDDWLLGINAVASSKQETTKRKNKQNVAGCWSAESEGQVDVPNNRLQKMKKKSGPNQPVQQVPKNAQGRRLVNWERRKLAEKKLRQGFCECCEMRFDDVKKHLNSAEHSTFVKNESNYHHLDSIITNGYNVQQFVSKVSSHPKFYSETSSNSMDYSSPGKIVLLTLSSSTSTNVNPPKTAADAALTFPDTKPNYVTISSESNSVKSENSAPGSLNNTLTTAKCMGDQPPLSKDTSMLTPCMKTPVKSTSKMQTIRRDVSPSLNKSRSPLKCLLNSPRRLELNSMEKQASKPKGSSAAFPAADMVNSRMFLPETRSKNMEVGESSSPNENVEPVKSARYSPPVLKENITTKQNRSLEIWWESAGGRPQEIPGAATVALPRGTPAPTCLTPGQPLLSNTGKKSISPVLEKSSGSKCASLALKKNFRYSSSKPKRQRLFKLGEKWQVLSQQSVKKILFTDESPEPFTGFDPQDVFRHSDNSDVSYETVSEVILTDPSEFEWVLGNCEGKQVTDSTYSDPSSQATFFNNTQKNAPLRDPAVTDSTVQQEKSVNRETDFKKRVRSQEDNMNVSFHEDDDRYLGECTELNNSVDGDNSNTGSTDSESTKNYNVDNVDVYLNSHKDFPPYIPNGLPSGYCSPSFQQNSHIEPTLMAGDQHYPTNNFETKVIQDLDYSQTPRYLHLESVGPSDYETGFDHRSEKHVYLPNNQQFQYSDSNYTTNLDARLPNNLPDYPRLFNEASGQQSCNQALSQGPSLKNSQETLTPTPGPYSITNNRISDFGASTPMMGDGSQRKKTRLPQTPLPNLSYECSSLSVMSVDRTLNESDQTLDTPPDLPLGSSNSNNNNNNNSSFEAIPVLNFDSSFNMPVQNFPILTDFTQSEDDERRSSLEDFVTGPTLKDSELPANFQDRQKSEIFYSKKNSPTNITDVDSTTNKMDKNIDNNIEISNNEITNIDNRDCDNNKSKYDNYNFDKGTDYFNSYLSSLQDEDDKESYSETICTAETHSLISSLSQTTVVPLKTSRESRPTPLKCQQDFPSSGKLFQTVSQKDSQPNMVTHSLISSLSQTAVLPLKTSQENRETTLKCQQDFPSSDKLFQTVSPKDPKPDMVTLLENEMPQLALDSDLKTPTSAPPENPSLFAYKLPECPDDNLDLPPQLQLEEQRPPLLLDSQCQNAPPKLIPEVTLNSEQKMCLSPPPPQFELPSLSLDIASKDPCPSMAFSVHSPPLFSSSSSSSSHPNTTESPPQKMDLNVPEEEDFSALPKFMSRFETYPKLNPNRTQCSLWSYLAEVDFKEKCLGSTTASHLENDSQRWDAETNPISVPTSYDSTLDRKPGISLSSSFSPTSSDSNTHGVTANSKSESEVTDSSLKHPVEGMDTSEDTYATSEYNGLKHDSSTEVKDSGFLSVEEFTPKKSPSLDVRDLSLNMKKLSNIARPCSVVLEKTPDTLLVHTRFPLHKAVDQQNTFSVKRVDNNVTVSPNSKAKPRLLKRLSDNQKTFRLDYIHGNNGGRKNLSRTMTSKTRSTVKQRSRFK